jgi:hypothetical protein
MLARTVRFLIRTLALAPLALAATQAHATFHLWVIDQIYSDATGNVQFVELFTSAGGQEFLSGHSITASSGNNPQHTFTFPADLPGDTTNRHFLIATEGFAALGIVKPDYVVPNGFLYTPSGSINYAGVNFVNYQNLPTDGVHSIDASGNVRVNSATNFAGQTGSVSAPPPPPPEANYQGLWWASPAGSESGWGLNVAHQGNVIFATWFTYDASGKALWLSMTATEGAAGVFSGQMVETHGPAFSAVPFNPALVTRTVVGSGTLTFADASDGTFAYTVNGVSQQKAITREAFGPLPVCTFGGLANLAQATNYQDIWWASPPGSESGWGINLTQEGDTIFGTWFTYDVDGTPLWLSVTATPTTAATVRKDYGSPMPPPMSPPITLQAAPTAFSGSLVRTAGPAFSAVPFNPNLVTRSVVGTATFTFTDGADGTFAYTVNGVSQVKNFTREVFVAPGTACQ